jgi:mono/diheme cytochrome c family protein
VTDGKRGTMKNLTKLAAAGLLALGAGATALDAGADDGRVNNDVRVRLHLSRRSSPTPVAKFKVKNRGRLPQAGVTVRFLAGDGNGTEMWSSDINLPRGASRSYRFAFARPEGVSEVTVTATLFGKADERPWDNQASADLGTGTGGGGGGTVSLTGAQRGMALYTGNCAVCHGADARGGTSGEGLRGRSASDILEAIREGEEPEEGGSGMPTFPGLDLGDCQDLAAYLADPDNVMPPPPPPPPPVGGTVTYAGQIAPLMQTYCVACHQGANAYMGVKLATYAQVSANAAPALSAMQAGTMPKGGTPLSAAQIQMFADWIAGGKPQ